MQILIAKFPGLTPEMSAAFRALGLEPVFLPGADGFHPGSEEARYDLDFSGVDAVICYRFFCSNDISLFPSLRFIHTTSHGIDHMPMDYIRAHGIRMCDARGVYSVPMAEYALGAVLQLYKDAPAFYARQKARLWEYPRRIRELAGRQITILGTGSVGAACAERFSAMGCRCVGLCRHPDPGAAFFAGQRHIRELDEVLPETDVLLVTLPLSGETRGLMDARRFALLKEDAVLVNIARGPIVDAGALLSVLESGRLSGAAVDVFDEEPLAADSPLWDAPNLILTPHSSFIGEHNPQRFFDLVYKNTVDWLSTL